MNDMKKLKFLEKEILRVRIKKKKPFKLTDIKLLCEPVVSLGSWIG